MPKTARKQEDVNTIRKVILDAALEIMISEGFAQLSMRKIAARSGMTAANIYNYYSNKDEIYLAIQTRGFKALFFNFQQIDQSTFDSLDKLKRLTRAYFDFGTKNPELYEIMFTRNTPKFTDYLGTKLEPAAIIEKEAALRILELTTHLIYKLMLKRKDYSLEEAHFRAVQQWTSLHGIVSLYNSRVLQEAIEVSETTIEKLTSDLLLPLVADLNTSLQANN